jgi:importin-5
MFFLVNGFRALPSFSLNLFPFYLELDNSVLRSKVLQPSFFDDGLIEKAPMIRVRKLINAGCFYFHVEMVAWTELSGEIQNSCKAALLESFRRSSDRTVRNRISDAISQVASLVSQYEEWRELMEFLVVSLSNEGENDDSINALLRIVSASPDLFSNQETSGLVSLVSVLSGVLSKRGVGVAVEGSEALCNLTIFFYPDEKRREAFLPVVTQIIPSIVEGLRSVEEREEELGQVLNCCASLVFECPRLFVSGGKGKGKGKQGKANVLGEYISMAAVLIRRLTSDQYGEEDVVASAALELICAAVEGNPGAFRRDGQLLEASSVLLLQVAGMESDTSDWLSTDPTDEDDLLSMSVLGQQSLDRFALALGGSSAGPVLFNHIGSLLTSTNDWRSKYSALMAIASTAEGCAQDFLEDHLEGLLAIVWPCFGGSEHARVQYAACHALGQLCTDFPGRIQEEFARDALSALLSLLQNSTEPRVQCHASAALVNFAENCDPDTVSPFLDGILGILAAILARASCPGYLKEQLIATIGAYSGAAQSRFAGFFDQLAPLLIGGLDSTTQSRKVQCRAVEALSLVLLAVKDASEVQGSVNTCLPGFLHHLQTLEESMSSCLADDPMREFLSEAWLRMARLLGPKFATCLPVILPSLFHAAESEVKMVELPENDDEAETANFIPAARVNGRNVGINTSSLSEKAAALESLAAVASAVGPGVFGEAERLFLQSVKLVNFEWSGDVRCAAIEAALAALECLQFPPQALEAFITCILQGLTELYETDFACSALDGLSSAVKQQQQQQRTQPQVWINVLPRLSEILQSMLQLTCDNICQIVANAQGDEEGEAEDSDNDDIDDNQYLDTTEEEEVLYAWGRLQGCLFEAFPEALDQHKWAINFCSQQIRIISLKSTKKASAKPPHALDNEALQHVCLGVLCDAVEGLKTEGSFCFGQEFIDSCLTGLSAPDSAVSPLIRQVAAHLAGQLALHGPPEAFKDFSLQAAAPLLDKLVRKRDARAPSQLAVTDNAVSALIKIHSKFPGSLAPDTSAFIGQFILPGIPVITDEAEVSSVAAFLMQNFNSSAVWAPTVLQALVTVKTTPSAACHLKPQIADALQPFLREQLAAQSPQIKDRILSSLSPEQVSRL